MSLPKGFKYAAAVIAVAILAMVLHGITARFSTVPADADWSSIAMSFGFIPTAFAYLVAAFGIMTLLFLWYERKMRPARVSKGLRYGFAMGLLWLWGMLEGVSYGNPVMNELVTGIADAAAIVILGLLLSKIQARPASAEPSQSHSDPRWALASMLVFSILFVVVRYTSSFFGIIQLGGSAGPVFTSVWTLVMGATLGLAYVMLARVAKSGTAWGNAVELGVVVIGANWLVFTMFMPLMFDGLMSMALIMGVVDILALAASALVCNLMRERLERAEPRGNSALAQEL